MICDICEHEIVEGENFSRMIFAGAAHYLCADHTVPALAFITDARRVYRSRAEHYAKYGAEPVRG